MRVTTKAPCRVDLAGATLDIWPLYLFHENPVTVNFAVTLYTHCDIVTHRSPQIVLRSKDLRVEETFESLAHLRAAKRYRLPVLARLIRYFEPGIRIHDGVGIGSSGGRGHLRVVGPDDRHRDGFESAHARGPHA